MTLHDCLGPCFYTRGPGTHPFDVSLPPAVGIAVFVCGVGGGGRCGGNGGSGSVVVVVVAVLWLLYILLSLSLCLLMFTHSRQRFHRREPDPCSSADYVARLCTCC